MLETKNREIYHFVMIERRTFYRGTYIVFGSRLFNFSIQASSPLSDPDAKVSIGWAKIKRPLFCLFLHKWSLIGR